MMNMGSTDNRYLGSVLGDGGDVVAGPGPAITQIPQSQALK